MLGALVPLEPEPPQILDDPPLRRQRGALGIGVLDAKHELAAGATGEQPVEERGARVADVKLTGRARGEAETHGDFGL